MNNQLETLYSIDIRDKVRHWSIFVNGDSYHTESGLVGSEYKVTKTKPKKIKEKNVGKVNYTTAEEQAVIEARRVWETRFERGDRPSIEAARKYVGEPKVFFQPMLAEKYSEKAVEGLFPLMVQPKLDGIRCVIRRESSRIVARSRNGKEFDTLVYMLNDLEPLFKKYPELILDGELYNHELKEDFNKIISLVRKKQPTSVDSEWLDVLDEARDTLQYHIYDIPQVNGPEDMDGEYWTRTVEFVQELKATDLWPDNLRLVQTWWCHDLERVSQVYNNHVTKGYEGSMVRLNKGYETSRSKSLLKYKEFKDAEFLVIGIDEGEGNRTGTAKHLVCKDVDTGKVFNSNIKGTFEWYTELLENKDDYIGKMVTIQFANLTPDGIPRFPFALAFRDYE